MAYYAAVISLKRTIKRLLFSSHISFLPSDREIIESIEEKVDSLRQVLDEFPDRQNKRVEPLREQIRDAAYKLEDALDSHVSDQFLSRSERLEDQDSNSLTLSLDVSNEVIRQEIDNFADMVEKIEKECSELSQDSLSEEEEEEEEDDDADSSRVGFVGTETKMVGLSDTFSCIKEHLLKHVDFRPPLSSITGMAGIGKTTMAKKIYHDLEICNYFNCRLWVTASVKCRLRKILLSLLAQLDYNIDNIQKDEDEKLGNYLSTSLRSKSYLTVIDDVWTLDIYGDLERYLPTDDERSHVLLTSRGSISLYQFKLHFLNEEESWCLLREKVFGQKSCPYALEKVGKKIAKICDGLPLLIVTVADLLSKAEKTVEYWTKIAEEEDKSIFMQANEKISNTLLKSYKYLPQHLKALFLYMAIFPPKCVIPASKLYNLWSIEDISRSTTNANYYLFSLLNSSLVLEDQYASTAGIKTCRLHLSYWYACVKQSWKEKFLHVISSSADSSREGAISRRRLGIYNNVLFGIKEVYDSIESISSARSLICSGPYHQYPIRIFFGLRLLKVLDVLSVRFYKFPIEVLKLFHLKYLALTYNGKIPTSISKLWNLEYLIVRQHLRINFPEDWSYLPVEIWNLKKLRHLQVTGSCLPYFYDAILPELLKILGISPHSFTKEIFERIPNLEKLGIQIEFAPNFDATQPLSCFDHLSHLDKLQSLKCVVVNPNPARPQFSPISITTFPSNLIKLSLSGFEYPWNYMRVIGKLPYLRVLKLQNYAFRGPKWEVHEDEFPMLEYLLLQDLDLVHMTFDDVMCFRRFPKLIIMHCYKFKMIPLPYAWYYDIKIVDSPLIARFIQENTLGEVIVDIRSSWDSEEHKGMTYTSASKRYALSTNSVEPSVHDVRWNIYF